MSVEFNEENNLNQTRPEFTGSGGMGQSQTSGLISLVMKLGLADNEESANKVLTIVAVCAFLLTLFVIFKFIL